jgi:cytochrome b561
MVCSLIVVLGTLFGTKWSGGNLFGINMLFHDFHLCCGLLLMMLSLLRIS